MSFLDKPISELTSAELRRLISNEVARQVPAIPTGVLGLSDLEKPVTVTTLGTQGQVPTFHAPGTNFVFTSPGSLSDGVAPTLSPDLTAATSFVQGGIGLINAVWLPVTNGDPVAYDIHISSTGAAFTPTALTLYASTMATSVSIKAQANGSSLLYNIPYYIRIVAFDNDGAAAAGASVVAGTKISADIGTITAGTFIGTTFETSDPAGPAAARVIIDPAGVHLTDSSGGVVVDLPTDALASAQFNGAVTAASLVSQATTLNGTTQVAGAASLTAGVGTPSAAPALIGAVLGGSLNPLTRYYVAYAWSDGTHETLISPVASILPGGTNNTVNITLPPCPSGATQAIIYFQAGSTFSAGLGHRQGSQSASTTASSTAPWTSYNNAGAGSLAAATGPFSSTTATIRPTTVDSANVPYGWSIEGSGKLNFLGAALNSQFWLYDDFYGPGAFYAPLVVGSPFGQCWVYRGQGASNNIGRATPTSSSQNGILALATGTTATGHASFGTDGLFVGTMRYRFSVRFQVVTLPGATNSLFVVMGLSDASATTTGLTHTVGGNIGITFQNSTDSATGTLDLVSSDGTGTVARATGPTLDTSWHFAEFDANGAGTSISWWVDGIPQTAITTHIPPISSIIGVAAGIEKTAGLTSRNLNIDTIALFGDSVSG